MDLLGHFLKATPAFRGKGRLTHHWAHRRRVQDVRFRRLPTGASVACDMAVPYEAMVWLEQEEEADLNVLRQLLRPGDRFVDCGANIGLWTLVAAERVGPAGKVFAFEPNPGTFKKLTDHVVRNNLGRVVSAHQVACGETAGAAALRCGADHNVSAINDVAGPGSIMVEVVRLDEVLAGETVTGIKLDVEGFELRALLGAESILRDARPWLCVEFNTLLAGTRRLADWPVHRYLESVGYECRRFVDALEDSPTVPVDAEFDAYINLFYSFRG